MKPGRSLYLVVTGIAACGLWAACLIEWYHPGIGEGWHAAATISCGLGAVGVIYLGWQWFVLAGAIASIAGRLRDETVPHFEPVRNKLISELGQSVNDRFSINSAGTSHLEQQSRDMQIQIKLSQRQKQNAEAIVYSIREAVVVIDESDRLIMANEAAGKIFGFDFKAAGHKSIAEVIAPAGAKQREFVDFLCQSRKSKVRHSKRELELSKDGQLNVFNCIVSCIYDEKDQVCGVVAVLHDITREKEISQMKNDFVSHVSHELKTPLASITAYSEMLVDGEADDEKTRKEFYSIIQSQAKRLNRLIEDMLNISRIESGLIKVDKKTVSLAMLIEDQVGMIKSFAQEKNIQVIAPNPIVFDQVYADSDMISQVIVNLLSNAVKYTPSGGTVTIDVAVDEIRRMAKVSVTDTGVGIPEDEIGHLFEKFFRVKANNKCAKGTGLGLNLVKQIVEKVHNGRIFVTSKVGQGSTFGFELPLATAELAQAR